ncbi:hypothetical protein DITRI_Ditri20bG0070600 [Diplodiscus trichospermus]
MAMITPAPSLVFKVRRSEPELVALVDPTPRKDPARAIRDALAKALVFYYPFAGRLREGPNRKLWVDCTGEGVLFVEGDADVTLEQFVDELQPPFPCMDELLFDVPGYGGVLNSPLFLIQVFQLNQSIFVNLI